MWCRPVRSLWGVALVADVEQQSVVTEIEDVMHRDGQFDHPEIRSEMSTGLGDLIADREPNFRSQLVKLL